MSWRFWVGAGDRVVYSSRSRSLVKSSLADICFVWECCWNFLAFLKIWNLVSTDLSRAIIWRGPFLLEKEGLPTRWELTMSSDWRLIPAFDVASRILALVSSPGVSWMPEKRMRGRLPYCSRSSSCRLRSSLSVCSLCICALKLSC